MTVTGGTTPSCQPRFSQPRIYVFSGSWHRRPRPNNIRDAFLSGHIAVKGMASANMRQTLSSAYLRVQAALMVANMKDNNEDLARTIP